MTAADVRPVAIKIDEDITTRVKRLADAPAHVTLADAIDVPPRYIKSLGRFL